jgi:hypothetical protein
MLIYTLSHRGVVLACGAITRQEVCHWAMVVRKAKLEGGR